MCSKDDMLSKGKVLDGRMIEVVGDRIEVVDGYSLELIPNPEIPAVKSMILNIFFLIKDFTDLILLVSNSNVL